MEARKIENKDIEKYIPMINGFIWKVIVKNWSKDKTTTQDEFLGNTSLSIEDFKQILLLEVYKSLMSFNPNFIYAENKKVKEFTYVYRCVYNKTLVLMKTLTKKKRGYETSFLSLDDLLLNPNMEEE